MNFCAVDKCERTTGSLFCRFHAAFVPLDLARTLQRFSPTSLTWKRAAQEAAREIEKRAHRRHGAAQEVAE